MKRRFQQYTHIGDRVWSDHYRRVTPRYFLFMDPRGFVKWVDLRMPMVNTAVPSGGRMVQNHMYWAYDLGFCWEEAAGGYHAA